MPEAATRPRLTLPEAESACLLAAYNAASVILEYGSGGSTVMAAEMPGKTVFSVESDKDWANGMAAYLAANPMASKAILHHVDIGATAEWGKPVDDSGWRRYHHYPLTVWDRDDFSHPDVVLIDGRFRVACLLATLHRITRPVLALFDDYAPRPAYHRVEAWVKPSRMVGRMACFDLQPRVLPMAELSRIMDFFTRPN